MITQDQDKRWNSLSEEQRAEYRKEFQQESKKYHQNIKHCDRENDFEYYTGYSNGVISTLEDLFGEHNLKPNPLTYNDVIKELFKNGAWQVAGHADPREFAFKADANDHYFLNCSSEKQGQKLSAINRLLNVAKFLNRNEDGTDWVPDWEDILELKYYPLIDHDELQSGITEVVNRSIVYFRSHKLFETAIQILGEETIKLALSFDY